MRENGPDCPLNKRITRERKYFRMTFKILYDLWTEDSTWISSSQLFYLGSGIPPFRYIFIDRSHLILNKLSQLLTDNYLLCLSHLLMIFTSLLHFIKVSVPTDDSSHFICLEFVFLKQ